FFGRGSMRICLHTHTRMASLLVASLTVVPLLAAPGEAARSADEPAIAKLEAARTEHEHAVADAQKKLIEVVDTRLAAAKDNGDLKAVERFTEVKKSLETDNKLPEGTRDSTVLSAARQRDRAVDIANTKLLSAYDTAVRELTRAGKLDEAKAIQKE